MSTIVRFYKDGKKVKEIISIGYLPVDESPVEGSRHLVTSGAGGNSLTTGKLYQLTCVGSCWTLAEFTVPTP